MFPAVLSLSKIWNKSLTYKLIMLVVHAMQGRFDTIAEETLLETSVLLIQDTMSVWQRLSIWIGSFFTWMATA